MSDSDFALRLAPPSELREMVQTLTRERDEARAEVERLRAEVEKLRALPSAEDLEERAHEILDGAGIPTHALDPVSGEEDYRAGLEERLEWTVEEITRARADAARLRGALEEATRALAVDPRFLSPARLGTARSILAAALAGEGEACENCGHRTEAHAVHRDGECMVVMAGREDARPGGYCPCPGTTPEKARQGEGR